MQTFLPYSDFRRSASVLDNRRLGKQRVEVLQILRALAGETRGWVNHPCARMWRLYPRHLIFYGQDVCTEWEVVRGFKDSCYDKITAYLGIFNDAGDEVSPKWLGDPAFHASHRSNLLRKDFAYYSQFGWTETPDLPYVWP